MTDNQARADQGNAWITYLLLAFGITWLCWIPTLVIADTQGYQLPILPNVTQILQSGFTNTPHVVLSIVFSLAVYGPLIGAGIAILSESGRPGLNDLLHRMVTWRVSLRWYASILGIAIALPLIPRLIGEVSGTMQAGGTAAVRSLPMLLSVFLWQVLTSGLGEEPGWRGYLLPRLQSRYPTQRAIWILGAIWAVWHYPITIYTTLTGMPEAPFLQAAITLIMALLGQTMSLIGMTYLYTWIYNGTESVWLAMLFHALSNVLPWMLLSGASPALNLMTAVMPWIIVFILEKISGDDPVPKP
jgi:uncharacterized protein